MAAIHDLQATVEAQGTVIESAVALLHGLHQKLEQCGTDEAKLNELKDEIAAHTNALAEAVATNTVADEETH